MKIDLTEWNKVYAIKIKLILYFLQLVKKEDEKLRELYGTQHMKIKRAVLVVPAAHSLSHQDPGLR